MSKKWFLYLQAITSLLFAFSMIFMSKQMTERYMMDVSWENPATDLIRKGMGSLLIGIACGSWMARNSIDSAALRAWILSSVIGNVFLVVFHINAIRNQIEKPFAYVTVIICTLIAVWGLLLLIKRKPAA